MASPATPRMIGRIVSTYRCYLIEVYLPSGDWVALALEFDTEHEAIGEAESMGLDLQEFNDRRGQ